jgi:hypothetical protein
MTRRYHLLVALAAMRSQRFGLHHSVPTVIPAKAGVHLAALRCSTMDPGFRRDDDERKLAIFPAVRAGAMDVSPASGREFLGGA